MTANSRTLRAAGFRVEKWKKSSKKLQPYFAWISKPFDKPLYDNEVADMLETVLPDVPENPRSIYDPDKHYDNLLGYAPREFTVDTHDRAVGHGIKLAYSCFARHSDDPLCHPLPMDQETCDIVISNKNGSAGLTAVGFHKGDAYPQMVQRVHEILVEGKKPYPALVGRRTQEDGKTRTIWMEPGEITLLEGSVGYSINRMFFRGTTPMAYHKNTITLGAQLGASGERKKYWYSIDYSQYDATVPAELIQVAFRILRTWYDLDEIEPRTGATVRQIFEVIENNFIKTYIVLHDGLVYKGKDHGVPSGSYFTQIIDSIVNCIIAGAMSWTFHLYIDKRDLYILGDDLLFYSDVKKDLDDLAEYANRVFHVKLHGSEKSEMATTDKPVKFLGRIWMNGFPDNKPVKVAQKAISPEHFRRYPRDKKLRHRQQCYMLLTLGKQYPSFWKYAFKAVFPKDRPPRNYGHRSLLMLLYDDGSPGSVDPDHLSGLMRMKLKYEGGELESSFSLPLLTWC